MRWQERDGIRWLEAELPGARAYFSTRGGGVSEGPFRSLNIGLLTGDERASVRENRHRLTGALDIDPRDVLIGRQVHAAELAWHDERQSEQGYAEPGRVRWVETQSVSAVAGKAAKPPQGVLPEVDAQATASEALVPLVFVADCLPVALAGPGGVAMVHCGWRGLAAGIIARGVEAVGATAAAIGPGIGRCCYEVGDEVLDAFEELGDGIADGRMLDLAEVARRRLAESGMSDIEASGLCTSCEGELFFSHRRDAGRTGRQAGMVRRWPS